MSSINFIFYNYIQTTIYLILFILILRKYYKISYKDYFNGKVDLSFVYKSLFVIGLFYFTTLIIDLLYILYFNITKNPSKFEWGFFRVYWELCSLFCACQINEKGIIALFKECIFCYTILSYILHIFYFFIFLKKSYRKLGIFIYFIIAILMIYDFIILSWYLILKK